MGPGADEIKPAQISVAVVDAKISAPQQARLQGKRRVMMGIQFDLKSAGVKILCVAMVARKPGM